MPSHARERRLLPDSIRGGAFSATSSPYSEEGRDASRAPDEDRRRADAAERRRQFQTRRRRMRDLLASREDGFSLEELQDIFDLKRNVALDHLKHLHMSLRRAEKETLLMVPPRCEPCGYTFRLEAPAAPGRCPRCKSEKVVDPVFKVDRAEA